MPSIDPRHDPVRVSPAHYTLLLENDRVRVLDMHLQPGEIDEPHAHPSETVYFLRGGTLRIHLPNGEVVPADFPDGGVMWHEPWSHRVENVGATAVHAIIVEDQSGT
jgi:quercetin dioxygenase-like cupin family protein